MGWGRVLFCSEPALHFTVGVTSGLDGVLCVPVQAQPLLQLAATLSSTLCKVKEVRVVHVSGLLGPR